MDKLQKKFQQDQNDYWNGEGGARWLDQVDQTHAMLIPITNMVMRAADAQSGECVVDIGCGTGDTSRILAEAVGADGKVIGADISTQLVAHARDKSTHLGAANTEFHAGDATVHDFNGTEADLVFSRFGVMFFGEPKTAFANIRTSLKPGGRLVFACWQPMPKSDFLFVPIKAALEVLPAPEPQPEGSPTPFAFGDPAYVTEILSDSGFTEIEITPHRVELEFKVEGGLDAAADRLANLGPVASMLEGTSEETKSEVMARVAKALEGHQSNNGVTLGAAFLIVKARNAR